MKMPSQDQMKARFWELKTKRDAQRAKADPARAEYDKLVAKHAKEVDALRTKIRSAEDGLGDLDMEMATLVRAVGGSMGEASAAKGT